MSYVTQGQKGLEAAQKKNWNEAISLLSKALEQSSAPQWLLARSQAYQEIKKYHLALADADHAYASASERQQPKSLEQKALAQYRRAVVLGHMKRYADADACCVWSQQLIEGKNFYREADNVCKNVDADGYYLATKQDALSTTGLPKEEGGKMGVMNGADTKTSKASEWTRAYVWRSMMLAAMEKLPKDDPARKITVQRIPEKPTKTQQISDEQEAIEAKQEAVEEAAKAQTAIKWATKKLRVDFYQTPSTVNLVLYAKGADKDKVRVDINESEIHITNLPETAIGSTWTILDLDGKVDTTEKTVKVTPFKIELTLKKNPAGHKWAVWGKQREEGSGAPPTFTSQAPQTETKAQATVEATPASAAPSKPPAYPTSSRSGPKNWEKFDDEEDAADSNPDDFFKQLYKDADPDTKRAMMKSYVESNGTSLSTDWSSVGSKTVPTQPPEGMDAKKW